MQVMGKPQLCSSPASPFLSEAISFCLCDLEPAAVDWLRQPVPDCLEPESCSSKPGNISTPNGCLGLWVDVVTATPMPCSRAALPTRAAASPWNE